MTGETNRRAAGYPGASVEGAEPGPGVVLPSWWTPPDLEAVAHDGGAVAGPADDAGGAAPGLVSPGHVYPGQVTDPAATALSVPPPVPAVSWTTMGVRAATTGPADGHDDWVAGGLDSLTEPAGSGRRIGWGRRRSPGRATAPPELVARLGRPLPADHAHHVAVVSLKGGVGKTTVAALLGLVLAAHRSERIVTADFNPDAGTLAERLLAHRPPGTIAHLAQAAEHLDTVVQLATQVGHTDRLDVVASTLDPSAAELDQGSYRAVLNLLDRFYQVVVLDLGTDLMHPASHVALARSDCVVVVGTFAADGASRARTTVEWLEALHGERLVGRVVAALCGHRSSSAVDHDAIRSYFAGHCAAVVDVPLDAHLAAGGRVELGSLEQATLDAALTLADQVIGRGVAARSRVPTSPAPWPMR